MSKVNLETLLIGSDFEMFLVDKNDKVISAIPLISGTKDSPEKTDKEGCCIQHDNVLSECNVPPVGINEAGLFWENIQYVKNFILGLDRIKGKSLSLKCCPSAIVEDDQLQDDEAKEFGCDASFNAWRGGEINEKPHSDNPRLRSGGGHWHFSFDDCDYDKVIDLVRLCDLFLGVPFVLIDKDKRRRELYGKAGEFRFQSWGDTQGFEYRVLSNCWADNQDLVEYVFSQIKKMFEYYNENGISKIEEDADKIIRCINTGDEELAGMLCEKYDLRLILELV